MTERDQDDLIPYEEWEEPDPDTDGDGEDWETPEPRDVSELDFVPDETYRGDPEEIE